MSPAWMPLYVGDYLSDTAHLGALESGGYLHLIMHYWRAGKLPRDDASLARIAKMTAREWSRSKSAILAFFDDELRNKRIDLELAKACGISEKRKLVGALGGNAKALKSNVANLAIAKKLLEQNARQSQSQSQPERKEEKPKPTVLSKKDECLEILTWCVSSKTADDLITHRKAIKSPMTPGAAKGLVKKFRNTGDPEAAALDYMASGYRGFFPKSQDMNGSRAGPGNGVSTAEQGRRFIPAI